MTSLCSGCFLLGRKRVPFVGPVDAHLAVVGEAPGRHEVIAKIPFCQDGQSGQDFNRLLRFFHIDRAKLRVGNALLCGPIGENEKDTPEFHAALVICRARREAENDLGTIRTILALGVPAGEGLLAERIAYGGRQPRRGALHWDALGRRIIPSWHPAAMRRAGGDSTKGGKKGGGGLSDAEIEILAFDIERAWLVGNNMRGEFKPEVLTTDDPAAFVAWVAAHVPPGTKRVSIDVETDSIDPTKAGLLTVGLAVTDHTDTTHAISFRWTAADAAALQALRELLARPGLLKGFFNIHHMHGFLSDIMLKFSPVGHHLRF